MHPAFNKVQKMAQKCAVNAQGMRRECAGNAFAKKGPLIRKIGTRPKSTNLYVPMCTWRQNRKRGAKAHGGEAHEYAR